MSPRKMDLFREASRADYDQALAIFDVLVSASTAISQGASGRPAESGRHYHASLLYTRLCGWGVSALMALPGNRLSVAQFENWDFPAIASISRNLIECYIAFFYLCVEPIEKEEWECRWNIFNLHDCLRRKKFFELIGEEMDQLAKFDETAEELRDRLRNNKRFLELEPAVQKDCLKARKLYLQSQDELVEKFGIERALFRGLYVLLSSHVHTFPLGFYRIGMENRGRGLETEVDRMYMTTAVKIASFFIRRAAKEMIQLFPGADEGLSEMDHAAIIEPNHDVET